MSRLGRERRASNLKIRYRQVLNLGLSYTPWLALDPFDEMKIINHELYGLTQIKKEKSVKICVICDLILQSHLTNPVATSLKCTNLR